MFVIIAADVAYLMLTRRRCRGYHLLFAAICRTIIAILRYCPLLMRTPDAIWPDCSFID